MVNYPTSSSVAVIQARVLLNRILRKYHSATAAGKAAIAQQFIWFTSTNTRSKDAADYPATNDPSAQAARVDIAALSRHYHSQVLAIRNELLPTVAAAVLSVGGVIPPVSGTVNTSPTPLPDAAGRIHLNVRDRILDLDSAASVAWISTGDELSGAVLGVTGEHYTVTPKSTSFTVTAYIASIDGAEMTTTWTIPAATTLDVQDNMQDRVYPTFPASTLKALTKTQLVQLATGVKTLAELQGATS